MTVLDLTMPFGNDVRYGYSLRTMRLPLSSCRGPYTGVIHELDCNSMSGTYIDFPGHIAEYGDGRDAATAAVGDFYRMEARVVHLTRASESGAVTGEELQAAMGSPVKADCLVVNALGRLEPMDIAERTVWFDDSAVDWIVGTGCRVLVSDIYESRRFEGVFQALFAAGVCAVCLPANLWRLPDKARITALFCPVQGMMQVPCRLVGEID